MDGRYYERAHFIDKIYKKGREFKKTMRSIYFAVIPVNTYSSS